MPHCIVRGCKNRKSDSTVSFHRLPLPSDKWKRKAWLDACGRKTVGDFQRVCSDHFDASDFERDLKAELLNLKPKKRIKADAVPNINVPGRSTLLKNTARAARSKKRENKKLVEDLLASCETILVVGDQELTSKNKGVSITVVHHVSIRIKCHKVK